MGSGKRNYRSLRMSGRKWKKDQPEAKIEEEEKKTPPKEEVDKLIALFQKKKGDKIK